MGCSLIPVLASWNAVTMTSSPSTPDYPPNTPTQAVFGMRRAAEVAGVSVSTLRRNKELLRAHGAVIAADGWQVPLSALVASGLMRRATPPEASSTPAPEIEAARGPGALTEAQERIRELEREALELRFRAEKAEAIAQERGSALEAERMALRMLTTGPATPPAEPDPGPAPMSASQPPASEQTDPEPEPVRQSWWRRTFG